MSDSIAPESMQEIFIRCTNFNFHIIACLRAKKALDKFQVSQLSGENSLIKRSQMVLEWMKSNQSVRDIVLRVMEENEQEHVANLMKGISNGHNIPLSQSRYNRLVNITPKLMLIVRNDVELVARLRAMGAISEIDRQDITQVNKEYKRNWTLIEAILRRSDYAFNCLEHALRKTLQDHAANYLHEGQVVSVHCKTTQPEKDEVLSELLSRTILEESNEASSSEKKIFTAINGYNIHPVIAKPGESIVFYFYCKAVDNMITFTELFISGDLQNMMEVMMNRLLLKIDPKHTGQLKARLSLDESEILAVDKFSGITDWMPVELEEGTAESTIIYNAETQTEHQSEETDSKICASCLDDFIALKGKLDVIQKENDALKKLMEDQTPTGEERYRSDPAVVQTIRTKAGEEQYKAIRGLTILDNELFVSSEKSSDVEVYDSVKFSFSRRWNLRELISPQDIGSCKRNKCLYIIDSKFVGVSNEIMRVDPNGMLIKSWLTGDNCEWGLSVTDESNVISAVYDKHKLREYSSDGQLIREINLSTEAGIRSPRHAIKLTNGHFAVSHGSGNNEQHKVSIVDASGTLQNSYGGTLESTIAQMNSPVYLSIDSSGFVMVADHDNSRVLLLDPDLEFMKELLSKEKHGLRFPQRILLDESNGRLFVVDFDGRGGQILVFRLGK